MNDNDKKSLRKQAKLVREQAQIPAADLAICEQFLSSPFLRADSFFVYHSFQSETDTKGIINGLKKLGKFVCIPRVIAKGEMWSAPLTDGLVLGMYGIPAPTTGANTPCDVTLVPLLAADRQGNRIGYGGGYYDRYLAKNKKTVRVGVCYYAQLCESVPCEPWDEPLDFILTEKGIIRCENEGREALVERYLK